MFTPAIILINVCHIDACLVTILYIAVTVATVIAETRAMPMRYYRHAC